MRTLRLTIVAVAALALPLSAQVVNTIQADIPFEFVVGNTVAPTGTYVFSFDAPAVRVQLVGAAGRFVMTGPPVAYRNLQTPRLVFHRYGKQYFLSQIGSATASRDVPMSAQEREARKTTLVTGRPMRAVIALAATGR